MSCRLRPRSHYSSSAKTSETTIPGVQVALRDVLPALSEGLMERRQWLVDLLDEEIVLSQDLHEVLQAVELCREGNNP